MASIALALLSEVARRTVRLRVEVPKLKQWLSPWASGPTFQPLWRTYWYRSVPALGPA